MVSFTISTLVSKYSGRWARLGAYRSVDKILVPEVNTRDRQYEPLRICGRLYHDIEAKPGLSLLGPVNTRDESTCYCLA